MFHTRYELFLAVSENCSFSLREKISLCVPVVAKLADGQCENRQQDHQAPASEA